MSILARLAVIVSWIGHPLVFVTMGVGIVVTTHFERTAWISKAGAPDFDGYLAERLHENA
jgi:hypothetical protein